MKTKNPKFALRNASISLKALDKGPDHHKMIQVHTKTPPKENESLKIMLNSFNEGEDKMNQVLLSKDEYRNSLKFCPNEGVMEV